MAAGGRASFAWPGDLTNVHYGLINSAIENILAQGRQSGTFPLGTESRRSPVMRVRIVSLIIAFGLMIGLGAGNAPGQVPAASLTFRNDTKAAVIVQGTSNVGGMIRRGQPVLVAAGRTGGDFNVPAGQRSYTVYDANQPSRVLAKDVSFVVPAGANVLISIRLLPNNQIGLVPEPRR
jgi:hypothetical protein